MIVKAKSNLSCRNAVQVKIFLKIDHINESDSPSGNRRTWTIEDLKQSNVKALFKWPEFKTISETYAEMKIKVKYERKWLEDVDYLKVTRGEWNEVEMLRNIKGKIWRYEEMKMWRKVGRTDETEVKEEVLIEEDTPEDANGRKEKKIYKIEKIWG